jgi:hypothetical protein
MHCIYLWYVNVRVRVCVRVCVCVCVCARERAQVPITSKIFCSHASPEKSAAQCFNTPFCAVMCSHALLPGPFQSALCAHVLRPPSTATHPFM